MRYIIMMLLFICSFYLQRTDAQELNAQVTLDSRKVQTPNTEIFTSLENDLKQLFNTQKWTSASFGRNEKIDCTVSLIINEMLTESSFVGEIVITSRRPVYNSTYLTPMLNYRDSKFEFNYLLGQMMPYNEMNITDNFIAVCAFYAYILIGFDFDSFSLNGGKPYYEKALNIANSAQSLGTKGWEPFSSGNSRYDLAIALTEESSKDFHTFWYNYHRQGLDRMSANAAMGRKAIIGSVNELNKLYESRPNSVLLSMFAESKLDELIKICSEATTEEKKELRGLLQRIFPTKKNIINNLN